MSEKYSRPIIEKAAELDLKDIYNKIKIVFDLASSVKDGVSDKLE